VNILITPIDGVITQVTNEALHLVAPQKSINLTANLYFSIASTVVMAIVMTIYTDRFLSRRLGAYHGAAEGHAEDEVDSAAESRGLRFAGIALLACVALILLLTVPSWGLLRNPATGSLINDSPFMDGLIFIITLVFLVLGICYGRGARTLTSSNDIMNAITKTFSGLAGLIFMLLIISQFIAYFNYSNIATVVATGLGEALQSAHIPALWLLLVLFILMIYLLDIIIPGVIPKRAIFAPIFVPLFYRLGIGPQTVLAAYRVGDSPFNVVTPLMVYLPFIVIVAQRYKKDAGIGTVI
jgi:aminobenzoyl-glutamate transport protein